MGEDLSLKWAHDYAWSEEPWTLAQWAEKYSVCVNTIVNWKRTHKAVIEQILEERKNELAKIVIRGATKAYKKLYDQIDDEDKKISQGAARAILDKGVVPEQNVNIETKDSKIAEALRELRK